ncbi:hypothetical protein O181_019898, partial [Austropuccinia psidii MF-1]|nr:hypothetical protein [Austropuccinia psidii MF-1]
MMKVFPSGNGHRDPKQAYRNHYGQLAVSLTVSICLPRFLGHHPMVTSLLEQSEVIILKMKDGDGERTFQLGPIVTMSCHPWDSNAKKKTHTDPPRQDCPIPHMPCKQTPRQPTPGLSGTQWLEDLSREHSQHNEPPITDASPSSKPPQDVWT